MSADLNQCLTFQCSFYGDSIIDFLYGITLLTSSKFSVAKVLERENPLGSKQTLKTAPGTWE